MRLFRALVAGFSVLSFTAPVVAATVTGQGSVLVNRGQGYKPVGAGQVVQPGQSILVNENSSARLSFDGGCAMQLQTGGMYVVPTEAECVSAQNSLTNVTANTPFNLTPANVIVGGLAIAGIVGGAILLAKDNSSSP